ncbi:MAG TPA: LytR C-terminal domain-containing protein [Methylomirabilota bacterium]|nr:LytR C-terminal domain-containing protein [Methylomirabilota bacterium]
MQTKKRAKPVKFGKRPAEKAEKPEKKEFLEPQEEVKERKEEMIAAEKTVSEESEETPREEGKEQKEEELDDEPMAVHLGTEESPDPIIESKSSTQEETELVEEEKESEESKEFSSPFGSFSTAPEGEKENKGPIKFFLLVAFIAFLIGLGCMAAIYHFKTPQISNPLKSVNIAMHKPSPTPTSAPTSQPTPTVKSVDKSAYTISVFNGSGTTGEAAKVKSQLTSAGFIVGKVGNADTSDYTKTEISAKKSVNQAYIDALISTLKKQYSVDANVQTLSSGSTDVVVTIGSTPAKP